MKKALDFLGWLLVFLTIVTTILTLLTTYRFTYIKYFDGYLTLQWCIVLTMGVWSIRMCGLKKRYSSIMYPLICLAIVVVTIIFMYMRIY